MRDSHPSTADAVIVGGGVMGCSILYNLAVRGLRGAALFEKEALASGSTSRSQAILRMHYSNEVTARMAWQSLDVFRDFEQMVGTPSGFVETGYFLIAGDEQRAALEANVAMQKGVGIETDVVAPSEAEELAPVLSMRGDEAVAYEPGSGYADPYSVTTGYANRAREMGARVIAGANVTGIEVSGGGVSAVVTDGGRTETRVAVVTAGPWSGPLLRGMGVDVPLRTLRHQVVMLRRPEGLGSHPIVGDVVHDLSTRPDAADISLIGIGEDEFVGPDEYNQGVDARMVERAAAAIAERMPAMSEAQFMGGWSGLFTVTPDWHPVLDRVEGIDGLFCAVGFSGHGFKLSPMIGAVMAELTLEGQASTIDDELVASLRLGRFSDGELLGSRYNMNVLA